MKKYGFKKSYYMPIATNIKRFKNFRFNVAVYGYEWERAGDKRFRNCMRGVVDNETELLKFTTIRK